MTEQPTEYFDLARSWADDRDAAAARSLRVAWTITGVTCSIAILEALALAFALPLKEVVPMAVLVDRTTGYVERVDLDRPRSLPAGEALQQSLLGQYVVTRESFDPITIRTAYRKVAGWSSGQARSGYLQTMRQGAPDGQLVTARREIALAATIRSVSMLSPTSALVRFDVAHVGFDGRNTDPRPYVATMSFGFRGQPATVADRLENPLGFEVKSYRVDAEAPPPRTAPVATSDVMGSGA